MTVAAAEDTMIAATTIGTATGTTTVMTGGMMTGGIEVFSSFLLITKFRAFHAISPIRSMFFFHLLCFSICFDLQRTWEWLKHSLCISGIMTETATIAVMTEGTTTGVTSGSCFAIGNALVRCFSCRFVGGPGLSGGLWACALS
jgi:hypothetical protein